MSPQGFDVEQAGSDLQRDASARLVSAEDPSSANLRFQCSEFEALIDPKEATVKDLWWFAKTQYYKPLHITASENMEWWWFRGDFYKVGFEKGHASRELAQDLSTHASIFSKPSLSGDIRDGYSAHEIAEGVFELQGKKENDAQRAERWDKAKTIGDQLRAILSEDAKLNEQDNAHDPKLEEDDAAKIYVKRSWFATRVLFESRDHQPPERLPINASEFRIVSTLQKYLPILVAKRTGRGKLWRSEVVTEWWWFKERVYVTTRPKGIQSAALSRLAEQREAVDPKYGGAYSLAQAEALPPKYSIGNIADDPYGEGYAPEEIVRLVFTLNGAQETLEMRFNRIRAAKDLLSKTREFGSIWTAEGDALYRILYRAYLDESNEGYRGSYQQWLREQAKQDAQEQEAIKRIEAEIDKEVSKKANQSRTLQEIVGGDSSLNRIHYMAGWEFEQFMSNILRDNGYTVALTRQSGDQGVDILLKMNDRTIAVQLKRYTRPVGNKAVQEVLAGRVHYAADEAWVISTSSFTKSAVELARSADVRLIDGDELKEWLRELNVGESSVGSGAPRRENTHDHIKPLDQGGRKTSEPMRRSRRPLCRGAKAM